MSNHPMPTEAQIAALHRRMDAEQIPVIENLAVTQGWGFGRIIQICHQLWDAKMVQDYGIPHHSGSYCIAEAQVLLEAQARQSPEHAAVFEAAVEALTAAEKKMK